MSAEAAKTLEVSDLELAYRVRGVDRPVLRGISFAIERGRSYGLVGESGCGKSTAALGIVRYLPRNGSVTEGRISVGGRRRAGARRARASRLPRAHGLDGLPEPGGGPEPEHARRRAGRRGVHGARSDRQRGIRPRARGAAESADRRPVQRDSALSAPALGRDAAAGGDRDGAGQGSGAPHPGRADHGARRDRRGGGARPRNPAPGRARYRRALHQPQPRGDLEDVRSRRGALRRAARRGGPGRARAPGSEAPVHRRAPALHPSRRSSQRSRQARHDPGVPPEPRHRDRRLRVRGSLRARRRALPRRGASTRDRRTRAREPLLVPRACS